MAGYNKIDRSIWRAGAFASLSDDGKLVHILLLTGPQAMSIPGVLVAGPAALAEELEWEVGRFKVAFQELERAGIVEFEPKTRLVWVPSALWVHNRTDGPNQVQGWAKYWGDVPGCDLKGRIWRSLRDFTDQLRSRGDKLPTWAFEDIFPVPEGVPHPSPDRSAEASTSPSAEPSPQPSPQGYPHACRDPEPQPEPYPQPQPEKEGSPPAPLPPPSADGDLFGESAKKASKGRAPKPPPSADAIALAEHLRQLLVRQKAEAGLSPHHLADSRAWASTRTAWATGMQTLLGKAGRTPERARELLAWSFSDQGDTDPKYRTRVDSPGALVEKWDKLEAALARNRVSNTRPEVGHYKHTGDEEYAGGEVEMPRAGGCL